MRQHDNLSFNCAESVLLNVTDNHSIPGCAVSCMKIASVLGGGISGAGEVCGAVSGGVLCLGLSGGTEGNEIPDVFKKQRSEIRGVIRMFLQEFEDDWGSLRCSNLVAMDNGERVLEGHQREKDESIRNHCDDYVKWSTNKILVILNNEMKTSPS